MDEDTDQVITLSVEQQQYVRKFLDFCLCLAEEGRIIWNEDAPIFFGISEEVDALLKGDK